MARTQHTPKEIQEAVSRKLHTNREVQADRANIRVPLPMALAETDETGCNWEMEYFGNATGYVEAVKAAVSEVKMSRNLISIGATTALEKALAKHFGKLGLQPNWVSATNVVLRDPEGNVAPFAIRFPEGYWDRYDVTHPDTQAVALNGVAENAHARYDPNSKARFADELKVDIRSLDE